MADRSELASHQPATRARGLSLRQSPALSVARAELRATSLESGVQVLQPLAMFLLGLDLQSSRSSIKETPTRLWPAHVSALPRPAACRVVRGPFPMLLARPRIVPCRRGAPIGRMRLKYRAQGPARPAPGAAGPAVARLGEARSSAVSQLPCRLTRSRD